jgi:hypothetical protein
MGGNYAKLKMNLLWFAEESVNTIIRALQKIHYRKTWKQLLLLLQINLIC